MPKVCVRIGASYTIKIGDYESAKPLFELEVQLDEGEEFPEERLKKIADKTRSFVNKEIAKDLKNIDTYIQSRKSL